MPNIKTGKKKPKKSNSDPRLLQLLVISDLKDKYILTAYANDTYSIKFLGIQSELMKSLDLDIKEKFLSKKSYGYSILNEFLKNKITKYKNITILYKK